LTDYRDALGTVLAAAAFGVLLDNPYPVSGMAYWPVNVSGSAYGLPDNNTVGFDSESTLPVPALPWAGWAVYGFHLVSFVPQGLLTTGTTLAWTGDQAVAPAPYILKAAGTAQCIVPIPGVVVDDYAFQADPERAVYPWVVRTLQVTDITTAQWHSMNVIPASAGFGTPTLQVKCILPGTRLALSSGINDGFYAQAGIFLEPTFPRSTANWAANIPHIVDASHSLLNPWGPPDYLRDVGMRDGSTYGGLGVPEDVIFGVRRIRRFHDVLDVVDQNLMPLRYAYEIRRGIVTAYATDNKQRGLLSAIGFVWTDGNTYTGTQLGGFNDSDVNVHAGDIFRLLDADGDVLEEVRVASVTNAGVIVLDAPGLTTTVIVGKQFQVFLKCTPVPHEQSGEELLEVITDRAVARTIADWATQKGGYVPDITGATVYVDAVNRLYDDLNAPNMGDFGTLGILRGDIIVIDPAGLIPKSGGLPAIQESGRRPIGDAGAPSRLDPGVYVKGTPSPLDDNRGFYRVKKVVDTVTPPYLLVESVNTYAGAETSPVFFATDPYSYVVYPTVEDSALKKAPYPVGNGLEDQMALRPTLKRDNVTKAFSTRTDGFVGHSLRPFSYRVIRPTGMSSEEAIDLVLMLRERMLSLIELFQQALQGRKHGSYFEFQRDEHITELGSLTDPDVGLGVPSNLFIEDIGGRMDVVPYANNSGCLSILDRRAWVHDTRLDSLTANVTGGMRTSAPGDTSYTAYTTVAGSKVLPGLPERIDEILNTKDKFRSLRYLWLAYRSHKILGTLAAIRRFDAALPERLADQQKAIAIEKSAENVE
jgi:hypothetical protein